MNNIGWKNIQLGEIAKYSTLRVPTNELTTDNYISTENMLAQKAGKTQASSLPSGQVVKYNCGQTLVSNIRPYFQKIWYANTNGGCSADVLVFKLIDEVDSKYFYYLLSQDIFFNYIMAGSKGTKMPRGDKQQIMMWPLCLPPKPEQKAIATTLSCLDEKIELNNRINKTLEKMAQAIFKSWFIDFEPFRDEEFEESELGKIPKSWKFRKLGDFMEIVNGYSYKGTELKASESALMTIKNFDRNGGLKLDGFKEIDISGKVKDAQYVNLFDILVACTDLTQNAEIIGNPVLVLTKSKYKKLIASMDLVKILSKESEINNFFLYPLLKSSGFKQFSLGFTSGTTVLHLSKKAFSEYIAVLPSNKKIILDFSKIVEPLYRQIGINLNENKSIIDIRDALLPKLMSGEIRIPIEEVN